MSEPSDAPKIRRMKLWDAAEEGLIFNDDYMGYMRMGSEGEPSDEEIKILCPKCGCENEPHWCNARKVPDGYVRSFALCDGCETEFEFPEFFNPFSHMTAYRWWWTAESYKAQLAARNAELAKLREEMKEIRAKYQGEKEG